MYGKTDIPLKHTQIALEMILSRLRITDTSATALNPKWALYGCPRPYNWLTINYGLEIVSKGNVTGSDVKNCYLSNRL